jgi:hypothetical protein
MNNAVLIRAVTLNGPRGDSLAERTLEPQRLIYSGAERESAERRSSCRL